MRSRTIFKQIVPSTSSASVAATSSVIGVVKIISKPGVSRIPSKQKSRRTLSNPNLSAVPRRFFRPRYPKTSRWSARNVRKNPQLSIANFVVNISVKNVASRSTTREKGPSTHSTTMWLVIFWSNRSWSSVETWQSIWRSSARKAKTFSLIFRPTCPYNTNQHLPTRFSCSKTHL